MNTATIIGLVITGLSALAGIIIGVVKLIKSNNASETEHNNSNAAYGMVGGTQGMSHSQIYAAAHQQPTPQPIPVQPVVRPTIVPQRPVVMPSADAIYATTKATNIHMYGAGPHIQTMNMTPTYTPQAYSVQWTIPNLSMIIDHDQAQMGMDAYCNAMNRVAKRNQPLPEDVIDTVLVSAENQYRNRYYGNVQPV